MLSALMSSSPGGQLCGACMHERRGDAVQASSTTSDTLLSHRSSTRLHMTYSEKIASHC